MRAAGMRAAYESVNCDPCSPEGASGVPIKTKRNARLAYYEGIKQATFDRPKDGSGR